MNVLLIIWEFIKANLGKYFTWEQFDKLFTWEGAALVVTLVVLEVLLSVDNALVLGAKVKPLPEKQRAKALLFGIWGAYFFRFIMIGFGTYLIQFMWIKAIGALYLLYMAIHGLLSKEEEGEEKPATPHKFWMTVLIVEGLDIMFSLDSVTAAVALSDEVWVLLIGSMIGILAMRGVAQLFVKLLIKVPELNKTAFVLVGIIGVKLGLTLIDIEMPSWLLFAVMIIAFVGTFVVHKFNNKEAIA
jgi:YkoY family integral membrane protein